MRSEPHGEPTTPQASPDQASYSAFGRAALPPAPSQLDEPYPLCEDTTLRYRSGYRVGFCRLRLFRPVQRPISATTPIIALVTEQPANEGLSITNGIEVIAAAICRHYGLNPRHTVLIEHYDDRAQGYTARLPGRIDGKKFSCIVFERMEAVHSQAVHSEVQSVCLRHPQWRCLDKAKVETLIGQKLP